jgi:signal transduction histidine kinase
LKVVLGDALPPSARDMVSRAERRAGGLAQVTSDLLTLSRARDVAAETALTVVPLADLIREVVEEQRPVAERAGLALELEIAESGRRYRADPQGIEQLLRNLLANAIRYTPAAAGRRLAVEPGSAIVSDTGIGIGRGAAPAVRGVLPRGQRARGRPRGQRPRPGHRPRRGGAARRLRDGRERGRPRYHVHRRTAARARGLTVSAAVRSIVARGAHR